MACELEDEGRPLSATAQERVRGTSAPYKRRGFSECSSVWLEHLLWEQGVRGSNPCTPTNLFIA